MRIATLSSRAGRRMQKRLLTADLVERVHRAIDDPGPQPEQVPLDDDTYRRMTEEVLEQVDPGQGLWIFAYGSLLWNPTFSYAGHLPGTVHGWHRAYCLHLTRWRGTPEEPGLMLALDRGGSCQGVLFRLPEGDEAKDIELLLRREIVFHRPGNLAHWFRVRTSQGPIRALGFVANRQSPIYRPEPPLETCVAMLARACGHGGSCAEYLHKTVEALEQHGIRDNHLWRLQELVARRIRMDTGGGI
ncbi:MAG TPA: gamma-glutamylcyclotransferase [Geminicoccus sp.]|uniref:gamma-glutamylcyclotransferase n=1 Tax=Geminicoccus sp. TaxID=2024832 RepID=UPI002E34E87A|nr:gamma-glutamylcyclotransferase [Geminicoccus sp.]HEX2525640.1 gamma-glutamylcyclotransferase [Geminicoccus sp.]